MFWNRAVRENDEGDVTIEEHSEIVEYRRLEKQMRLRREEALRERFRRQQREAEMHMYQQGRDEYLRDRATENLIYGNTSRPLGSYGGVSNYLIRNMSVTTHGGDDVGHVEHLESGSVFLFNKPEYSNLDVEARVHLFALECEKEMIKLEGEDNKRKLEICQVKV